MAAAARVRRKDVFTDAEWETLSVRENWRGIGLIIHAWGLIAIALALFAFFPNPLTFIIAVVIVGGRQLGLAILLHEAAHGNLHPNKKINDFLGHWLCAAPVGAGLVQYRNYHLQHHKYVQQQEDPDLALSAAFPVTKESLRRKIIRDLTGQTFLRQRLGGLKSLQSATMDEGSGAAKQAEILSGKQAFRDHLIFNGALLLALTALGVWWLFPVIWLVSMATWMQLATRIRNIAEHACVPETDDPFGHARTTHASWWERLLFAPYWVNFHLEHHAFMHLPCYQLEKAHKMLVDKGYGNRIPQSNSYKDVLELVTMEKA